ncbi:SGNH/GDSL hydrolase family protein [Alkaliphilus crotonatoxidans]
MSKIIARQEKRSYYNRITIYFIIYFLMFQLVIVLTNPEKIIYQDRMNYDLVKNRTANIEAVFKEVKHIIEEEHLENYVVILGDSVAYSSPGPANTSIGHYLNAKAQREGLQLRVFNLSMPSMEIGDVYTMMLKMDEYGISRDNLVIDILYSGFLNRNKASRVFWLAPQLRELDPLVYEEENMDADLPEMKTNYLQRLLEPIKEALFQLPIFMYKDYIQAYGLETFKHIRGNMIGANNPVLPWTEKPFLKDLLKEYQYRIMFSSSPFIMDESNPQIRYLNRIIKLQEGKNTLIFLAPVNEALAEDLIEHDKYYENLDRIDAYFKGLKVSYLNLYGEMPVEYFSDHVHYTKEGYQYLSDLLWKEIEKWNLQ